MGAGQCFLYLVSTNLGIQCRPLAGKSWESHRPNVDLIGKNSHQVTIRQGGGPSSTVSMRDHRPWIPSYTRVVTCSFLLGARSVATSPGSSLGSSWMANTRKDPKAATRLQGTHLFSAAIRSPETTATSYTSRPPHAIVREDLSKLPTQSWECPRRQFRWLDWV